VSLKSSLGRGCLRVPKINKPRDLNSAHAPIRYHRYQEVSRRVFTSLVLLNAPFHPNGVGHTCQPSIKTLRNKARNTTISHNLLCCEKKVNFTGETLLSLDLCSSLDLVQQAVCCLNQHACDHPCVMRLASVPSRFRRAHGVKSPSRHQPPVNRSAADRLFSHVSLNSQTKWQ